MLIDTSKIKRILNISGADYDTVIADAGAYAESLIVARLGQEIETTTYTFEGFGNGEKDFYISQHPVNSITSIEVKEPKGTYVTYDDNYLLLKQGNYYYINFETILSRQKVYKIVYSYGYASIPNDIKDLANFYAVQYILDTYQDNDWSRFGIKSKALTSAIGNSTDTYITEMTAKEKVILSKYRIAI